MQTADGRQGFGICSPIACRSVSVPFQRCFAYKKLPIQVKRMRRIVCCSDFSSDILGPSLSPDPILTTETEVASIEESVDAVELKSESDMDYSTLKELLRNGDFLKADAETRAKLIQLAGEDAEDRGWIYFTEVNAIPSADMATINSLWKAASHDKFGYSVQKKIFNQNMKRWTKFFKTIDWTVGEDNNYRKWPSEFIYSLDAAEGHLPLTNCLRGTQLFEEVMNHKAFHSDEIENENKDTAIGNQWTRNL